MFKLSKRVSYSLLLILLFYADNVLCQSDSDTVYYDMIHDDPTYSYLGFGVSYDVSVNDHNFTMAAIGLSATYYDFEKKFLGTMRSRFHLWEEIANYNNKGFPKIRSIYETEKSRDFTLEGTFLLSQQVRTARSMITLDKKSNIEYVTEVDALKAEQYGIGLGVRFMTTYYNFGDSDLTGVREIDGKEVEISGITSSYFTQQVLRFSFSHVVVQDFEISTDKFGNRSFSDLFRFYSGLQFGVDQTLDDVLETEVLDDGDQIQEIGFRYNINETVELLPIGFFIGYEAMGGISKGWSGSLGGRVEVGLMPGPKNYFLSNIYGDLTVIWEFGSLAYD